MTRGFAAVALALPLALGLSTAASAQTSNGPEPVAEAARLRDAREFAAAIALLRRHLTDHPDDASAARVLAQTLYWSGDVPAARRAYEDGLRRNANDSLLRLEYARMLVQLDDRAAATALLLPLRTIREVAADTEALLGTLAYWRGDLTGARAHFRTALGLRPAHQEAQQGLAQIREATSPWLRTGTRSYRDDQPISRVAAVAEAGMYVSPLTAFLVHVEGGRLGADGARAGGAVTALLKSDWPRLRLKTELGGGMWRGGPFESPEWTGRAAAGLRLHSHLTASVAAEREPYLRTFASLWQPVTTDTVRARLDLETPSGWIGQASYSHVWYPDANAGDSAHGWVLAPLLHDTRLQIHAGYAYAREDTRASRFAPLPRDAAAPAPGGPPPAARGRIPPGRGRPPFPPGRPGEAVVTVDGYYAPYYTPMALRAHSVAAALAVRPAARVALRVNGSIGVHAREDAPFLYQSTADGMSSPLVQTGFTERRYTPLNARGALDVGLGRGVRLQVEVDHMRTALWRGTQISAGLLIKGGQPAF